MDLHESTKDYAFQCKVGRDRSARLIQECRTTDNLPKLVREVQTAAADQSGYGTGFLFTLAREVVVK